MNIIATPVGFVLRFDNLADLQQHVENLIGFTEHIEQTGTEDKKFIYGVYDERATQEEIVEILQGMGLQ